MLSQQNQENHTGMGNTVKNETSIDGEYDNTFNFAISITVDDPALENRMLEVEKRGLDAMTARDEHCRVIENCIELKLL